MHSTERRHRSIALIALIAVLAAVVVVGVITWGEPDLREALEAVCDEDADISSDGESFMCTADNSDVEVTAFVTKEDPYDDLVQDGDGYETGDGTPFAWAVRHDGSEWTVVTAYFYHVDDLEPLEDLGFEISGNGAARN